MGGYRRATHSTLSLSDAAHESEPLAIRLRRVLTFEIDTAFGVTKELDADRTVAALRRGTTIES